MLSASDLSSDHVQVLENGTKRPRKKKASSSPATSQGLRSRFSHAFDQDFILYPDSPNFDLQLEHDQVFRDIAPTKQSLNASSVSSLLESTSSTARSPRHMLIETPLQGVTSPCPGQNLGEYTQLYEQDRRKLTHYRCPMVCGFCPGTAPISQRTFKRHLASVHDIEQSLPDSSKLSIIGTYSRHSRLFNENLKDHRLEVIPDAVPWPEPYSDRGNCQAWQSPPRQVQDSSMDSSQQVSWNYWKALGKCTDHLKKFSKEKVRISSQDNLDLKPASHLDVVIKPEVEIDILLGRHYLNRTWKLQELPHHSITGSAGPSPTVIAEARDIPTISSSGVEKEQQNDSGGALRPEQPTQTDAPSDSQCSRSGTMQRQNQTGLGKRESDPENNSGIRYLTKDTQTAVVRLCLLMVISMLTSISLLSGWTEPACKSISEVFLDRKITVESTLLGSPRADMSHQAFPLEQTWQPRYELNFPSGLDPAISVLHRAISTSDQDISPADQVPNSLPSVTIREMLVIDDDFTYDGTEALWQDYPVKSQGFHTRRIACPTSSAVIRSTPTLHSSKTMPHRPLSSSRPRRQSIFMKGLSILKQALRTHSHFVHVALRITSLPIS